MEHLLKHKHLHNIQYSGGTINNSHNFRVIEVQNGTRLYQYDSERGTYRIKIIEGDLLLSSFVDYIWQTADLEKELRSMLDTAERKGLEPEKQLYVCAYQHLENDSLGIQITPYFITITKKDVKVLTQ